MERGGNFVGGAQFFGSDALFVGEAGKRCRQKFHNGGWRSSQLDASASLARRAGKQSFQPSEFIDDGSATAPVGSFARVLADGPGGGGASRHEHASILRKWRSRAVLGRRRQRWNNVPFADRTIHPRPHCVS